ncbi:MAG: discoidin domain-containing protein [Sphingobacteriaceae bacterium]|nr:discoidin domain-containing protein [Sphingobacteriaceae bacterium]
MKKIFNYKILLLIMAFAACKKIDSTYKDFVVPGGLVYTGKVTSPMVYAGRHRVKVAWLRGADPTVKTAKIFWNNYTDSVVVPIPPTGDTISVVIDNLLEKSYSFIVKTYDDKGHSSIPVELLGKSYGDRYQADIITRPVTRASLTENGTIIIDWSAANKAGGAFATEVTYTNSLNQVQKKRYSTTLTSSVIADLKAGTGLSYKTVYLPDTLRSIDTFYTPPVEINQFLYKTETWTIPAFSTQHDASDANKVLNIIDGNPATRWHTHASNSTYPHFVTVDMKTEKTITGFTLFRAINANDVRGCNTFRLSLSKDNLTWVDYGPYTFDRFTDNGQFYEMAAKPKARYFKFTGLTGPERFMVMGEIQVYGLKL